MGSQVQGLLVAAVAAATVIAGCANTVNSATNPGARIPAATSIEPCPSDIRPDGYQEYIQTFTKGRAEFADIELSWRAPEKLSSQPGSIDAIAHASMLTCQPAIDIGNLESNPLNVQTIMSVLSLETWGKLIRPDLVASAEPSAAPKPMGFANPADSYAVFLKVASRFPYFCAESGSWASLKQACQREIATIFAHAAQETGDPYNLNYPGWETSLTFVREATCWPAACTDYDLSNKYYGSVAKSNHYYGRGLHQLTYAYNYAAVSESFFQNDSVLADPDRLATDSELVLGSGLWFYMMPAPPKPSMHDVVVGTYKPTSAAAGIELAADGSARDKFAVTVSVINGANECSPENKPFGPELSFAERNEAIQLFRTKSATRYLNYIKILTTELGVADAELTPVEKGYNLITPRSAWQDGNTYCKIENGDIFGKYSTQIGYVRFFYLNATQGEQACRAQGYQSSLVLALTTPGIKDSCDATKDKFPAA